MGKIKKFIKKHREEVLVLSLLATGCIGSAVFTTLIVNKKNNRNLTKFFNECQEKWNRKTLKFEVFEEAINKFKELGEKGNLMFVDGLYHVTDISTKTES